MFEGGIFSVRGNIPNDIYQDIEKSAASFYKILNSIIESSSINRAIIRLIKPVNTCIILDTENIHFVFTNKGVGGALRIHHEDFRTKTNLNLSTAIAIVERDLAFDDAFGFDIPFSLLDDMDNLNETIIPYVKDYIDNEVMYFERLSKIVRFNPIFQGREFYINESLCFVLMPFNDSKLQEIYDDQVKPTVEKTGLKCILASDIYGTQPIIEDIWTSINEAKIIIADVTGRNPNVFYEIGVAHTVGKNVIIISQNIDDVPFDLRHLRCIIYKPTPRGAKNLVEQLKSTILNLIKR
jgi:hypothetical protein